MLTRIQKGSNIYAVFDLKGQMSSLDKISIMMINSNQNHNMGLAAIALEEMNGYYTSMLFNVTGKITLREYVSKNISQNDFRYMLVNLIDTIENFDEYMIDVRQVMLDMDSVFINELDHSISFLCIALKGKVFDASLYEFFKTVVENSYVTADNQGISYFNKVWNVIRSDGFSLQNMKIAMTAPAPAKQTNNTAQSTEPNVSEVPKTQISHSPTKVPPTVTIPASQNQTENIQQPQTEEHDEKKKGIFSFLPSSKKKKDKPQSRQFMGFQGGLAGYRNNKPATENKNPFQNQPDQTQTPQNSLNAQHYSQTQQQSGNFIGTTVLKTETGNPALNTMTEQNINNSPVQNTENNSLFDMPFRNNQKTAGTTVLNPDGSTGRKGSVGTTVLNKSERTTQSPGTTVLKNNIVKKTACLIRVKNHERVFINKPVTTIGRDEDNLGCNVHDNTAVGHRHANIIQRDDSYFIMDLNSVNHTYLNGIVIQSGAEMKLSDGDNIILADEKFLFKIL